MASIPESHRDLLDAPVGSLATIGADGRPQASIIWFLAEGDTVRFSLNTSRQKTKNLLANPAANFLVLDGANSGRYLELRGDVTTEADPDYVFADKVGAKYGGVDLRNMDAAGGSRLVVTLNPVRVNAIDLSAR